MSPSAGSAGGDADHSIVCSNTSWCLPMSSTSPVRSTWRVVGFPLTNVPFVLFRVLENHRAAFREHARVMTRHRGVVDDHGVVGQASDRQAHSDGVLFQQTSFKLQR